MDFQLLADGLLGAACASCFQKELKFGFDRKLIDNEIF